MKAYWRLLVVMMGLALFANVTHGSIIVDPEYQEINIGGSGVYNVTIKCTLAAESGSHNMTVTFYNGTTGSPTDKLQGNLTYCGDQEGDINLQKAPHWSPSQPAYTWNMPQTGSYNFQLEVSVNQGSQVKAGESFGVVISDNAAVSAMGNGWTVSAVTVPELTTFVLVGLGIVSLAVWHRRYQ